ncbi:MAG: hypothetical protein ACE37J_11075 [Pikeienuella sp.]|uniref:hypothetical protein n=1 Tax=Pikeienuella sp. TaxID=2831957 RepID=UPI00391AC6E5
MKFSQNRFYIESYVKCANCGTLVYDDSPEDQARKVTLEGATFCSQWCVDWKHEREARRAASRPT